MLLEPVVIRHDFATMTGTDRRHVGSDWRFSEIKIRSHEWENREEFRIKTTPIEVGAQSVVEDEKCIRIIRSKLMSAFCEAISFASIRSIDGICQPCHLVSMAINPCLVVQRGAELASSSTVLLTLSGSGDVTITRITGSVSTVAVGIIRVISRIITTIGIRWWEMIGSSFLLSRWL